jgi:hypothetical protein
LEVSVKRFVSSCVVFGLVVVSSVALGQRGGRGWNPTPVAAPSGDPAVANRPPGVAPPELPKPITFTRQPFSFDKLGPLAKLVAKRGNPIAGPNVSNRAGVSGNPQLAAAGNDVFLAWEDTSEGNGDILLAISNDGGSSFWPAINVSKSASKSSNLRIAATDGKVGLLWWEYDGSRMATYGTVVDAGGNVSTPQRLGTSLLESPTIAARDGWIGAAWLEADTDPSSWKLQYRDLVTGSTSTITKAPQNNIRDPQLVRTLTLVSATWTAPDSPSSFGAANLKPNSTTWLRITAPLASQVRFPSVALEGTGKFAAIAYETWGGGKHTVGVQTSPFGLVGLGAQSNITSYAAGQQFSYAADAKFNEMRPDLTVLPDGHAHSVTVVDRPDRTRYVEYADIDIANKRLVDTFTFTMMANRARVAANPTARFVIAEGSTVSGQNDLLFLRMVGTQRVALTLNPAESSLTLNARAVQAAATPNGAVFAWQAGAPGNEEIYFAALGNRD